MTCKNIAIALALLIFGALSCSPKAEEREIVGKYIAAYNAQDEQALREVVADTAKYIGQQSREPRLLLEHHIQVWRNPATSNSKLTPGKLEGKDVVVVWTKPKLANGTEGPWNPGAYLEVQIKNGKIAREYGTLVLYDVEMQKKLVANAQPPK